MIGGLVWDPLSSTSEFFSCLVSADRVAFWVGDQERQTVINQAELFPCLVARLTWPHLLSGRRNLSFIDNDGARDSLIRGYSRFSTNGQLIGAIWYEDAVTRTASWYDRVPSPSNPSDGPSRGDYSLMPMLCSSVRVAPIIPPCLSSREGPELDCSVLGKRWGGPSAPSFQ